MLWQNSFRHANTRDKTENKKQLVIKKTRRETYYHANNSSHKSQPHIHILQTYHT